jgi:DNA polymerase
MSREDRLRRLAVLAEEVKSCTRCRLHESRTQTVFSRGSPDVELVFVGEGPGAEEDRLGQPFVGPAGQLLDKMIVAMGYARDDVYIANCVKCRPPKNRKPEPDEIEACAPYLREQLELVAPRVLVALGATGVEGLIGSKMGITRLRGTWKLYRGRVPLMPTFHPAYLLRSPEKKREVWSDLKLVMKKLGKEPTEKQRR